jgi:hypothetical protein
LGYRFRGFYIIGIIGSILQRLTAHFINKIFISTKNIPQQQNKKGEEDDK